ncbi:MAG: rubrerythrin [Armatimonadetes bacterium]|nr:rubrerythrin [Armatimonadota bacterium]NIM24048.1 rubrerythrin [Armatimonadota bacterium]NIM67902.1 rubrerythrin [Armatimonadota bacterium]NIM76424.1 rubrerythrin [Armatimonadota bacterium]NIN06132.1 rubrerythrin [Armatimonadota bacterium]
MRYNADEVLEMAERMEQNGAKFYRKAMDYAADKAAEKMLGELAAMEDEHERTFSDMRAELTLKEKEPVAFDPDNEQSFYLQAMVDRNVFDMSADPSEQVSGKTMQEILQTAIGLEKDSIVFYLGLKELVPERLGKGRLDNIVQEEYSHIATLSAKLDG